MDKNEQDEIAYLAKKMNMSEETIFYILCYLESKKRIKINDDLQWFISK